MIIIYLMCDKNIQYLDKYQHRLAYLFPSHNCESKLTGCSYNRDLLKLVSKRFFMYFRRTETITIRFFILIATLAIQYSDFNYEKVLDHLLQAHDYMFLDIVLQRVVIHEEWRVYEVMMVFIRDCIELFSVSSARKA